MFKEKVRKLYYEKIKKNEEPVEEAEKKEMKKNKITINPEIKEHKGVELVRKVKYMNESLVPRDELAEQVFTFLKEYSSDYHKNVYSATFSPIHGEQSIDDEGPASATMIARKLKLSLMKVQQILDQGVKMGTVVRVGDAYTTGKVTIDDEETADVEQEAEKMVDMETT